MFLFLKRVKRSWTGHVDHAKRPPVIGVAEWRSSARECGAQKREKPREVDVLLDLGKKFLLGLVVAACLVGAHAAVVYSVVG